MTFEVELGGRTRAVSVERARRDGEYHVSVDGRAHEVRARRTGDLGLLLTSVSFLPGSGDGSSDDSRTPSGGAPATYEVFLAPVGTAGDVLVTFDGRLAVVSVNARRSRRRAAEAGHHGDGEQRVIAPMPGRVVRVLVAAGDEVTARQGVVVVEAMKMENELRATRAGRVRDVSVSAGTSVEAGRVLMVIE